MTTQPSAFQTSPRIDAATLRDLDVISAAHRGAPTLLSLLNRTRTRVGERVLRQRLQAPAETADAIDALQQAHQEIAAAANIYRGILDRADTDGTERYLGSSWQLPTERWSLTEMAATTLRMGWRRAYLSEVAGGQARVAVLLAAATDLTREMERRKVPYLRVLAEGLAGTLDSAEVREVGRLARRRDAGGRIGFDQVARGRGKLLLTDVVNRIGTIEAMWSVAVATQEHGWSYPRPSVRFRVQGLYHPYSAEGWCRQRHRTQ